MKKPFFLITLVLFLPAFVLAQINKCGADEVHRYMLAHDAIYRHNIAERQQRWLQHNLPAQSQGRIVPTANGNVYEIPTVVHVIHTGGAVGTVYNPTLQQIQNWIDTCNLTYAGQYAPFPDTLHGGVHIPIRLVLAVRDPSCNPTSGVERINGSVLPNYATYGVKDYTGGGNGASDTALKALSQWPNDSYYNIWLVTLIDGGNYSGFAMFPGTTPYLDGAVIDVHMTQSNAFHDAVMPHELGHAFGLLHTFWGSVGSTCPPNANCLLDGDQICDTEPHVYYSGCPTGVLNSCTNANYAGVQYNIMNYSSCTDRFTPDQRSEELFALFNYRYNLLTSRGLTPPGNDTVLPLPVGACTPTGIVNVHNNFDVGLRSVFLHNMVFNGLGYTYDGFQFYVDHTLSNCYQPQPVAHLNRDSTYTIRVTTGANPENVRGWIDFNNDGIFSASETIISSNGTLSFETHTASFTIPAVMVPCIPLRMRIASDISGPPAPTACSSPQYGQTEDFIAMIDPLTDAVSISALPGTTVSLGHSVTFTASPTHGGTNPQYQWFKNGLLLPGLTTASWTAIAGTNFTSGDVITAHLIPGGQCVQPDSAISNPLTMHITLVAGMNSLSVGKALVTAYPNPGDGTFVVDGTLGQGGDYELLVTNMMGQTVYLQTIKVSGEKLHAELLLDALPAGAYSLALRKDGETLCTLKLIDMR